MALSPERSILTDKLIDLQRSTQRWKELLIIECVDKLREMCDVLDNNDEYERKCNGFRDTIELMRKETDKIKKCREDISIARDLSKCSTSSPPVHLSWNFTDFDEITREICERYHEEMTIKLDLIDMLDQESSRDFLNSFAVIWVHTSKLTSRIHHKFDLMLIEAGIKD